MIGWGENLQPGDLEASRGTLPGEAIQVGSGDEAEGSWCQSCTLRESPGSPNIAGWKMGAPD